MLLWWNQLIPYIILFLDLFKNASSTARYTVSTVVTFVIEKNVEVATGLKDFPDAVEENHICS